MASFGIFFLETFPTKHMRHPQLDLTVSTALFSNSLFCAMHNGTDKPATGVVALVEHLNKILPLDHEEKTILEELFVLKRIKRRQFIH
ncbi:MAG: hypothetical protein AAF388_27795, partial [Bacteroidota bacterium]